MKKVLSSVYCVIDLLLFQSCSQVGYPGNETREVVQCLVPKPLLLLIYFKLEMIRRRRSGMRVISHLDERNN